MNPFLFLLTRFTEPSSYAGVAAVAGGIHSIVSGDLSTGVSSILGGLCAFLMPEGFTGVVSPTPQTTTSNSSPAA